MASQRGCPLILANPVYGTPFLPLLSSQLLIPMSSAQLRGSASAGFPSANAEKIQTVPPWGWVTSHATCSSKSRCNHCPPTEPFHLRGQNGPQYRNPAGQIHRVDMCICSASVQESMHEWSGILAGETQEWLTILLNFPLDTPYAHIALLLSDISAPQAQDSSSFFFRSFRSTLKTYIELTMTRITQPP